METQTMEAQTIIRKPGEGKALWFLGGLYDFKATGEETAGAMTVMEVTLPPGPCLGAPPPSTAAR